MIEAVVWDIGRVLVEWDLGRIYRDAIPDESERRRFITDIVSEHWHMQHDVGVPFAQMVASRQAEFPQYASLIALYATHWLESIPGPVAGTHALIERLTQSAVPQYAITNFGTDAWALFRPTFPILDHMQDIVVSGVERLVKPDEAIFELAAQRFDRNPATMLFIDDSAANVATASRLGWHTFHFTGNAPALEAEMVRLGLLPEGRSQ
ncbi:hydrolase [Novosphingobium sp. AAP83]|uniref:HAD family hydrolase n=1 Tax=Novosphingobium sp. AAP83 TaxID=1523425 RepID=UPI0006B97CC1|nr:HAD-IA family hydrolase [Novosphingobium sp. AAP83]KPF93981.1 hydrolase [Novosphingobium sp. AAP83]